MATRTCTVQRSVLEKKTARNGPIQRPITDVGDGRRYGGLGGDGDVDVAVLGQRHLVGDAVVGEHLEAVRRHRVQARNGHLGVVEHALNRTANRSGPVGEENGGGVYGCSFFFYLRRIVGDADVAGVADDAVGGVGAAAQVRRLVPGQHHRRLVDEVDRQVLRLGRRLCANTQTKKTHRFKFFFKPIGSSEKKNRRRLTRARHRLGVLFGAVVVLVAAALGRTRIGRHAVVGARLALVVALSVLVLARRTHCTKELKKTTRTINGRH